MSIRVKRLPGEVPWNPPYRYECSAGHEVHADRPVQRCVACPKGQPCTGHLKPLSKRSV
jgi:hypothetical protein